MIDINEAYKIIERIADSGGLDDDMCLMSARGCLKNTVKLMAAKIGETELHEPKESATKSAENIETVFCTAWTKKLKRLRTKKKPMAEKSSASKKKILSATEKNKLLRNFLKKERVKNAYYSQIR